MLIVAIPSLLGYVRLTATRVNPDPEETHDGTVWGRPSVSLLTLPDRKIAVAVLSNISSLGGTFSVPEKTAEAFAASQGR